jgi:membrane protein involved in colicin uptake
LAAEDAATLACTRRYEAECEAKRKKTKAEKAKRIADHKEAAAQIRQAKEKAAAEVKEAERIAYENRVAEERKRDAEEKAADEASLASWNEGQLKAAENGIPSFDCCTLMIKAMKMSVTGEGGQSAENQEGHWIHCDEKRVRMADRMIELHECTGCPSRTCSSASKLHSSRLRNRK